MFKRIRAWFKAPAAAEGTRPAVESTSEDGSSPSGVRIDFGDNLWTGANISIGNISGGSLVQYSGPSPDVDRAELFPYATEEHLRELEAVYLGNKTHLRRQIEGLGDRAPQDLIRQLNDTERSLAEIERKLAQLSRPAE